MAYQIFNPTTGELVKTWPSYSDQQVEEALAAAHKLYKSQWSKGPIQPRLVVLRKLADLIDARTEELARIITAEMGKLIVESRAEVQVIALLKIGGRRS
ncbi:aldehyde dehydrogenase family protein [Dyella sp.]|uniref:aldehyde dehydrogenase family protein n=1 Tax=Dyella sp. TaxID=1869338 RepID=UPI002ED1C60D